jgi:hypothetical protein
VKYLLALFFLFLIITQGVGQNLESGLIAHWSFNNDSANVILDESGNLINGTSYEIDYVNGISGKAIQFNSVQDAVFFPAKNNMPPESIRNLSIGTISVWFNFQNIGGNILPILYFGESSENEDHNSLIIEVGHGVNEGDPANRRLYFTIVNQRFCFDSRENLTPETWYHFVAVVDSNGNTGYLNGEELVNRRYNLGSNSTYHDFFADVPAKEVLSLGYGRFGQDNRFFHFKGMIDEVRIYNRALNSEEVEMLWNEGNNITGIEPKLSLLEENELKIYPNPANEFIQILTDKNTTKIDFFSLDGRKMYSVETIESTTVIAINHWIKGIYIAKSNDGKITKVVVQ